jgi:hypothetical protein
MNIERIDADASEFKPFTLQIKVESIEDAMSLQQMVAYAWKYSNSEYEYNNKVFTLCCKLAREIGIHGNIIDLATALRGKLQ